MARQDNAVQEHHPALQEDYQRFTSLKDHRGYFVDGDLGGKFGQSRVVSGEKGGLYQVCSSIVADDIL